MIRITSPRDTENRSKLMPKPLQTTKSHFLATDYESRGRMFESCRVYHVFSVWRLPSPLTFTPIAW